MAVLCTFLLTACGFDYGQRRIPNLLLLGMMTWGVGESFCREGPMGIAGFLIKSAVIIAVLYPLFKIGTLGAGDVKLLGVCAGYLPQGRILYFLFSSMLVAAIFSLIKLWKEKNAKERFLYLGEYLMAVVQTGNFRLYIENEREQRASGLCMAGPVLISVLLYLGGIY